MVYDPVRPLVAAAILAVGVGVHAQPVPASVQPPAGQRAAMTWTGSGELAYECRAKSDAPGAYEWAFAGPDARLSDAKSGAATGRYFAGPTWEANDGSRVTGKQVAIAAAPAGNIPYQLVRSEAGTGSLKDVTYIQRVNTRGGTAPAEACGESNRGARRTVPYSADYVFYKGE